MMARRLRQTLMDYMVIGISPALIMGMVGSLLFFLLTVLYHGQHEARLHFIFAMFTLAVVLIARISMEEGIEYASLFGIALAIVTALALARFVQIQGPFADYSLLINCGFLAIVWWSAHKLTWDCTFIDDAQDASGEGLLQGMGLDAETVERQVGEVQSGSPTSAVATRDMALSATTSARGNDWYQRMVQRRRRPHTPGVWVLYYALAVLPLFAIGQLTIPAGDTASRVHAFRLICVFIACALGLLLTTSFLGLRRYLRQRNLQMPVDMAGVWLGLGAAIILAVLFVCILLPRPGASLSISQLPFGLGSPRDQRTHRQALGNDGPERPEKATRINPNAQQTPSDAASHAEKPQRESSDGRSGQPNSSPPSDQSSSSSDAKSDASKRGSDASPKQPPPAGQGNPRSPESSPKSTSAQKPSAEKESKSSADTSSHGDQGNQDARSSPTAQPGQQKQSSNSNQNAEQPAEKAKTSDTAESADPGPERKNQPPDEKSRPSQGNAEPSPKQPADQQDGSSKSSRPSSFWNPARVLEKMASGIGNLLKLVFFAALVCAAAFFAWKYRGVIRQALVQLWQDLMKLWASLWGGGREAADQKNDSSAQPSGPPLPSFASFADPFVSGAAERFTTEQLVRYSFEALEAWGREQGCPRQEDQTPLEFSQQIAGHCGDVGPETQMLADLYNRVAYGRERVPSHRRDNLRRLWQQLHAASQSSRASRLPPP
ncbi:MAG: DUF4129 domain-containing protein [Pirellulaceae bacterium]